MQRLRNHLVGVDQGDLMLFSDFEDGGDMWTGTGPRERRQTVSFAQSYRRAPAVQVSISMWDVDTSTAVRADISAQDVTETGFDVVFKTWGDTRVARCRVTWMSVGELADEDDWDLA
ncbi:MAG: hypothetical protein HRU30_05920 [Rhodobacteraceae bacterium]|nr:hypothetical protein [Paracoccaceae bacterium]